MSETEEIGRRIIAKVSQEFIQLYQEGKFKEAYPLAIQCRDLTREHLGENHPDFASSLNNLAALYRAMGNFAAAEPLLKQALDIRRRVLGEEHPDLAGSLNNLAGLYYAMGNFAAAEPLLKQALDIMRRALGEEHPDFAVSLNTLALLYQTMGNFAAAEPRLKQALDIRRRVLGEEHPHFAQSLNNLAELYYEMGNFVAAESLYKRARDIRRRVLGENHPDFAQSLSNLALLYMSMGNFVAAEPLYKQALEIWGRVFGEEHPDLAGSLNDLAALYAATNRETEAYELMCRAAVIHDRMIGQVFSIGSESQRVAYLNTIQGNLAFFVSHVSQHFAQSAPEVRAALDLVLRRKAIGAEALAAQRDAVLSGKYPEQREQLKELSTLRMQIGQKTLAGPGAEGLQRHLTVLAQWTAQKEQLEMELALRIPEMKLEAQFRAADCKAIAQTLPPTSTLIEYMRFDVPDLKAMLAKSETQWKPAHYLAFVIPAGRPDDVQMVDLGEADPIDRLIAEFRSSITSGLFARLFKSRKQVFSGNKLLAAIFDPLISFIGTSSQLLIAPDGNLCTFPFEVLPTKNFKVGIVFSRRRERLIDRYHFSYLSVGRDVLRFQAESSGQPTNPLIIADPDFDLSVKEGAAKEEMASSESRQSRDLDRNHFHFSRLPGTRREGEQIARLLGLEPWLDSKALEGKLKASGSPQILHLATHGFFLKDQQHDPNRETRDLGMRAGTSGGMMERMSGPGMENPLLRSGIVLAGVNTWSTYGALPPDAEDGVLTAVDVSGLELLATDLVVLSACETGLGKIQVGEGVFGLRRTFMLAGAKTLVMSLWNVPDKQKYPDPYYWGAFICQGDPGPIRFAKK
jgi:tetratricopeptide (TPR) repeat protein